MSTTSPRLADEVGAVSEISISRETSKLPLIASFLISTPKSEVEVTFSSKIVGPLNFDGSLELGPPSTWMDLPTTTSSGVDKL